MNNNSLHTKTIGVVLSTVPSYSETFFRSKIKGLINEGHTVVLFVDYWSKDIESFPCEVVVAPQFNKSFFKQVRTFFWTLLVCLLKYPTKSYLHYRLDKKDGVLLYNRLKNLALNSFAFKYKLDWLHFGFGSLVWNRENLAQTIGANMAVSFRGYDLYLSPLIHQGCFDRLFNKKVKYHVLSNEMRIELKTKDISEESIHVIQPAINTVFFRPDFKKNIDNSLNIVTIARLHWKKGLEYTLEALAILKNKGVIFNYSIIGSGSEYERLIFAAKQLGLLEYVKFTGELTPDEVRCKLQESNIYLQYSIQEGFCNSVLEAQATGLLCVVSNAEGLSENVIHNQTGWVVPKRNPEALASKIYEVYNLTETEKDKIRNSAVNRVQEYFNIDIQIKKFNEFYKKF